MKKLATGLVLAVLALGSLGCDSRTDEAEGGVILSISDFDGLPVQVSVNDAVASGAVVQIGSLTVTNVVANPGANVSDLMSVELEAYEVRYTRADTGTRTPPTLIRGEFGLIAPGGNINIGNEVILGAAQLLNPPLSDLLVENGGLDSETGAPTIVLNLHLRYFGETLGGEDVASNVARFTVEFVR